MFAVGSVEDWRCGLDGCRLCIDAEAAPGQLVLLRSGLTNAVHGREDAWLIDGVSFQDQMSYYGIFLLNECMRGEVDFQVSF